MRSLSRITVPVATGICLLMTNSVKADAGPDPLDPQPGIRTAMERLVEEPLPRTTCDGCLVFALSHRPWGEAFADPVRDLLGYDGGFLRVRLDLRVGLLPWLDLGITRTNGILLERYDAWSMDMRLAKGIQVPTGRTLDFGVLLGATWFEQEDAPDAIAPWVWTGTGTSVGPLWLGGGGSTPPTSEFVHHRRDRGTRRGLRPECPRLGAGPSVDHLAPPLLAVAGQLQVGRP